MSAETTQALIGVARLVGAGIVGGLIASFATHRFTLSRERHTGRDTRKREFRSFIVHFRSEAAAQDFNFKPTLPGGTIFTFGGFFYRLRVPELLRAAAKIEDDFQGKQRKQFDDLMNIATGFTEQEANQSGGKERVIKSLDDILAFLDQKA